MAAITSAILNCNFIEISHKAQVVFGKLYVPKPYLVESLLLTVECTLKYSVKIGNLVHCPSCTI